MCDRATRGFLPSSTGFFLPWRHVCVTERHVASFLPRQVPQPQHACGDRRTAGRCVAASAGTRRRSRASSASRSATTSRRGRAPPRAVGLGSERRSGRPRRELGDGGGDARVSSASSEAPSWSWCPCGRLVRAAPRTASCLIPVNFDCKYADFSCRDFFSGKFRFVGMGV